MSHTMEVSEEAMRLLKEHQSLSLSVAIQNSTIIIPYSDELVQVFQGVRQHYNNGTKKRRV